MTETTQSLRPLRGAAMTRMALSVLTATADAPEPEPAPEPAPERGCERELGRGRRVFTERRSWDLGDEATSFSVYLWSA
ncbi:hypothetical protein ABZW10_18990 [Kitasatospora sp. NPDC004723]|uniref:hypothetical protein n=1 Tax=Kitasatospora sp. NPDC004723 TaxID=3154288 RepID=UPI0033BBAC76